MASDVNLTRRGRLNIAESGNESGGRRPVVSRLPADFERRRDRNGAPASVQGAPKPRSLNADVHQAGCPWAWRRPSAVRLVNAIA